MVMARAGTDKRRGSKPTPSHRVAFDPMGFLDTVRRWLADEAAEAKDSLDGLERRLDADLTRRERELERSPTERLDSIRAETGSDDLLAEVQDAVDRSAAAAEASAEVDHTDPST